MHDIKVFFVGFIIAAIASPIAYYFIIRNNKALLQKWIDKIK
jgi:hypothetical protein